MMPPTGIQQVFLSLSIAVLFTALPMLGAEDVTSQTDTRLSDMEETLSRLSMINAWGWPKTVQKFRTAIPRAKDTPTARAFARDVAAPYYLKQSIALLHENTKIPKAVLPKAEQFLRDSYNAFDPYEYASTRLALLLPAGRELAKATHEDPIILEGLASALILTGADTEAFNVAELATKRLQDRHIKVTYPKWVLVSVLKIQVRAMLHQPKAHQKRAVTEIRGRYFEALGNSLKLDGAPATFMAIKMDQIDRSITELDVNRAEISKLYSSAKALEGIDPWLLVMLKAHHHLHRGVELGSSRSEAKAGAGVDSWTTPAQHRKKALAAYKEAITLQADRPHPYAQLILIEAADPNTTGHTEREWFTKAVERQFDHHQAYHNMITAYYLSDERDAGAKLWAFGLDCIATGRFDTFIPQYIEYVYAGGRQSARRLDISEKSMLAALRYTEKEYIQFHSDAPDYVLRLKTKAAQSACKSQRWEEAVALFEELGDDAVESVFSGGFPELVAIRQIAYLMRSPHSDSIREVRAQRRRGKYSIAQTLLKGLLLSTDMHPEVRSICTRYRDLLVMQLALEKNNTVDLFNPKTLAAWLDIDNAWKPSNEGGFTVSQPEDAREARIALNLRLPDNFELSGRISRPADLKAVQSELAIHMGDIKIFEKLNEQRLKTKLDDTLLGNHHIEPFPETSFKIIVYGKMITLIWNGRVAGATQKIEDFNLDGLALSFKNRTHPTHTHSVSSLSITPLAEPPKGLAATKAIAHAKNQSKPKVSLGKLAKVNLEALSPYFRELMDDALWFHQSRASLNAGDKIPLPTTPPLQHWTPWTGTWTATKAGLSLQPEVGDQRLFFDHPYQDLKLSTTISIPKTTKGLKLGIFFAENAIRQYHEVLYEPATKKWTLERQGRVVKELGTEPAFLNTLMLKVEIEKRKMIVRSGDRIVYEGDDPLNGSKRLFGLMVKSTERSKVVTFSNISLFGAPKQP